MRGLWHRTVYRCANEVLDTSTEVFWLQGPRIFADIRQPVKRASFAGVSCLRDLNADHLAWLGLQNAFAGTLELNGTVAWWQRTIDLQPQGPFEDRARLQQTNDVLDEYGTEMPYYERWERRNLSMSPCWGLRLASGVDGRCGFLVRAGDKMMFARGRTSPLAPGATLTEALDTAATLEEKQNLLDFEVSLGRVVADDREWMIERSTLPFKAGRSWSIRRLDAAKGGGSRVIEVDDIDSKGHRIVGTWRVIDADIADAAAELRKGPAVAQVSR